MNPPTIDLARNIGKANKARGSLVLFFDDDGRVGGASWGRNHMDCRAMGRLLDLIVNELQAGLMEAPFPTSK